MLQLDLDSDSNPTQPISPARQFSPTMPPLPPQSVLACSLLCFYQSLLPPKTTMPTPPSPQPTQGSPSWGFSVSSLISIGSYAILSPNSWILIALLATLATSHHSLPILQTWVFAWLDTGKRRYAVYALVYLAPYLRYLLTFTKFRWCGNSLTVFLCLPDITFYSFILFV